LCGEKLLLCAKLQNKFKQENRRKRKALTLAQKHENNRMKKKLSENYINTNLKRQVMEEERRCN